VAVAHGQTSEDALERAMVDFVQHKYDVLAATTIIENGLDIPNVNTLIVNHADKYGLAQLYQLRGRVGRSDRRAYAYLLVPPEDVMSPVAKQRLAAIREFSDLGSGFRVAALDLEIRGAGNLLGGEQSGHIEAVGFDTYVKLLEQTVRELKGEEIEDEVRARVNLNVDVRIDETFIPDMNQRLAVYRRVAATRNEAALNGILDEVADRYGPIPPSVIILAAYGRIRIMADQLGVESIEREGRVLVVRFRRDARVDPMQLIAYVQKRDEVTLTPPGVLRVDLDHTKTPAARSGRAGRPGEHATASWWTKRATAGRVTPGFSKEEMVRAERRASGGDLGVLDRVAAVLDELSHA
jgi:transcription-repair coupling factor (superfamily II helicase)